MSFSAFVGVGWRGFLLEGPAGGGELLDGQWSGGAAAQQAPLFALCGCNGRTRKDNQPYGYVVCILVHAIAVSFEHSDLSTKTDLLYSSRARV